MKDKTLIHLSVVGSRSKGLASHNSDYDLKAVILHARKDYLLQNVTPSKAFAVDVIDPDTGTTIDVEGTLVDYLTMQKYILRNNPTAYDAMFGIRIHTTKESEYLTDLFSRAYNPGALVLSSQGLMRSERRKAEKKQQLEGRIKHATNLIYLASLVHAFRKAIEPPLTDAFYLLEQLDGIVEPELREQMKCLYEKRKVDKSSFDFDMTPFVEFVQDANDLKVKNERRLSPEDEQALKEEADGIFLSLLS